jgi:UDP-N-acetylglucosamine--N-acetylmuramyl-(pentapeptide) pyrophosphoryl-undecaprenol N-acetylglucosamine transferase
MIQNQQATIFIASGGTGGHIIPAKVLAQSLVAVKGSFVLLIADKNYRNYHKQADNFNHKIIRCGKFNGGALKIAIAIINIIIGCLQNFCYFIKYRPNVVVGFGGYATLPTLIVAIIFRVKIILYEQNAYLGKVNRLFACFADQILLSFSPTLAVKTKYINKAKLLGNIVREEFVKTAKEISNKINNQEINSEENKKTFTLMITGGSGGAKIFSDLLPKIIINNFEPSQIRIIQQVRAGEVEKTKQQYKEANIEAEVQSFFENIINQYLEADLIIARAGSSTIFELTTLGKATILVPFRYAVDNHQKLNAEILAKSDATIVFSEEEIASASFSENLKKIIDNNFMLKKIAKQSLLFNQDYSLDRIIEQIFESINKT